jgi:hypothetical protein
MPCDHLSERHNFLRLSKRCGIQRKKLHWYPSGLLRKKIFHCEQVKKRARHLISDHGNASKLSRVSVVFLQAYIINVRSNTAVN